MAEWTDHLEAWVNDPQSEANHLVLGMNHNQRKEARGTTNGKRVPTWV